ncbi:hypothetical protein PGB90_003165 [Kerria lacca]
MQKKNAHINNEGLLKHLRSRIIAEDSSVKKNSFFLGRASLRYGLAGSAQIGTFLFTVIFLTIIEKNSVKLIDIRNSPVTNLPGRERVETDNDVAIGDRNESDQLEHPENTDTLLDVLNIFFVHYPPHYRKLSVYDRGYGKDYNVENGVTELNDQNENTVMAENSSRRAEETVCLSIK